MYLKLSGTVHVAILLVDRFQTIAFDKVKTTKRGSSQHISMQHVYYSYVCIKHKVYHL